MPREATAVLGHVLCTLYNHALEYSVILFEATHGVCVFSCNLTPALLAE